MRSFPLARWVVGLALAWFAACAEGGAVGETYIPGGPGKADTATSTSTTGGPSTAGTTTDATESFGGMGGPPPDLGACQTDDDCLIAAPTCYESEGRCVDGACEFDPKLAGSPCDDNDACTENDLCDGAGACVGDVLECMAPHASGGVCNAGMCEGMTCDANWGNCNTDWNDGCETPLNTSENCEQCGQSCTAGSHATADCSSGTCQQSCDSPWENCDGDWGNGCEIPTGIPNQCDAFGLNAQNGCWTAHCGQSNNADAVNFGSWYCFECTTCHVPSGGMCQWCSHEAGVWYPAEACSCGSYEDTVCGP